MCGTLSVVLTVPYKKPDERDKRAAVNERRMRRKGERKRRTDGQMDR